MTWRLHKQEHSPALILTSDLKDKKFNSYSRSGLKHHDYHLGNKVSEFISVIYFFSILKILMYQLGLLGWHEVEQSEGLSLLPCHICALRS